jgi:putative tryptophan/tyrosine transport system substrate-binding protein
MRRREFIGLLYGAAAPLFWLLPARAQQTRTLRLGIVAVTPRNGPLWVTFEQRLRQLGYVDGQNLMIEFIQVDLQDDTIRAAMTKIVSSDVDIIVTGGNEFIAKAALAATKVIPIVIVAIDYDPLALGYVAINASSPGTGADSHGAREAESPNPPRS